MVLVIRISHYTEKMAVVNRVISGPAALGSKQPARRAGMIAFKSLRWLPIPCSLSLPEALWVPLFTPVLY
jgi:hypothetical protein